MNRAIRIEPNGDIRCSMSFWVGADSSSPRNDFRVNEMASCGRGMTSVLFKGDWRWVSWCCNHLHLEYQTKQPPIGQHLKTISMTFHHTTVSISVEESCEQLLRICNSIVSSIECAECAFPSIACSPDSFSSSTFPQLWTRFPYSDV